MSTHSPPLPRESPPASQAEGAGAGDTEQAEQQSPEGEKGFLLPKAPSGSAPKLRCQQRCSQTPLQHYRGKEPAREALYGGINEAFPRAI